MFAGEAVLQRARCISVRKAHSVKVQDEPAEERDGGREANVLLLRPPKKRRGARDADQSYTGARSYRAWDRCPSTDR